MIRRIVAAPVLAAASVIALLGSQSAYADTPWSQNYTANNGTYTCNFRGHHEYSAPNYEAETTYNSGNCAWYQVEVFHDGNTDRGTGQFPVYIPWGQNSYVTWNGSRHSVKPTGSTNWYYGATHL